MCVVRIDSRCGARLRRRPPTPAGGTGTILPMTPPPRAIGLRAWLAYAGMIAFAVAIFHLVRSAGATLQAPPPEATAGSLVGPPWSGVLHDVHQGRGREVQLVCRSRDGDESVAFIASPVVIGEGVEDPRQHS